MGINHCAIYPHAQTLSRRFETFDNATLDSPAHDEGLRGDHAIGMPDFEAIRDYPTYFSSSSVRDTASYFRRNEDAFDMLRFFSSRGDEFINEGDLDEYLSEFNPC
jgi:hypothetical protein